MAIDFSGILVCPDCRGELKQVQRSPLRLACATCERTCDENADGIVEMLPAWMVNAQRAKDEIEAEASRSSGTERSQRVVEFESAFHDEQAQCYDGLFTSPEPLRTYYQRLIDRQVSEEVENASFVVDLCCGTGKSSLPLVKSGKPVIGIDVSMEMLKLFAKKCRELGKGSVLLLHADASHPPLRSESCEAIMFIGGLHHIPDQTSCVHHISGLLKNEGKFLIHEPLSTHRKGFANRLIENCYALLDAKRILRAIRRRIEKLNHESATTSPVEPFTPFEKPFNSLTEVHGLLNTNLDLVVLRGQALMSLREFPAAIKGVPSRLLSRVVVSFDAWVSNLGWTEWRGSAVFAVAKRRSERAYS